MLTSSLRWGGSRHHAGILARRVMHKHSTLAKLIWVACLATSLVLALGVGGLDPDGDKI